MGHAVQYCILQKTCSPCLSSEGVVSYSCVMSGWWQEVLVTLGMIKNLNAIAPKCLNGITKTAKL